MKKEKIFILFVLYFGTLFVMINTSIILFSDFKLVVIVFSNCIFLSIMLINKVRYLKEYKAYFTKMETIVLIFICFIIIASYDVDINKYYYLIISYWFYLHCRILMNKIITAHMNEDKTFFLRKSYQVIGSLSISMYFISLIFIYKFYINNFLNVLGAYLIIAYLIFLTPAINRETMRTGFAIELTDDIKNNKYGKNNEDS